MTTATVTGTHPVYPHIFSTLYKGDRYDVNVKSDKVFFKDANDKGSYSYEVKSENVRNVVFAAVEKHLAK